MGKGRGGIGETQICGKEEMGKSKKYIQAEMGRGRNGHRQMGRGGNREKLTKGGVDLEICKRIGESRDGGEGRHGGENG